MKQFKSPHNFRVVGLLSLAGLLSLQFLFSIPAYAANQITDRSLTLVANGTTGGSMPGGIVTHLFDLKIPTGAGVRSVKFEYCTTAADVGTLTCTAPPNMDASTATLGGPEFGLTGGTMKHVVGSEANAYYIQYASASALAANSEVKFTINNVKNPYGYKSDGTTPEPNYTFFVRVTTYASTDATGTAIDGGTVTASTATPIQLDGTMPESLVFCTGGTIGQTANVPDCATATSGIIHFNQLFSPTDTAIATSQMAASTNAGAGYVITVNGNTLTSGSNTISGMSAAANSLKGNSQFGLNLRANTVAAAATFPLTSAEVAPAPNGTNYRGEPATGYGTPDSFKFATGDVVADSYNGAPGGTDAQIFTVSYIANVPGSQPAGNYSTTLTYICTPTY